jgi:hypothetical protein
VCDWIFLLGIYRSRFFATLNIFVVLFRYVVILIWATIVYYTTDLEKTPEYEIALNLVCYMLIDAIIVLPFWILRLAL